MVKDVYRVFKDIIEQVGEFNEEEAEKELIKFVEMKRIKFDVW